MPPSGLPAAFLETTEDALLGLLGRYARTHPPFTTGEVAGRFGLPVDAARVALGALETRGALVVGELRPGGTEREWCDPEVLRRLRRASLAVLRKEVEAVDSVALARFLPAWQGIDRQRTGNGPDRLRETIGVLQGLALPFAQWEGETLPRRISGYSPAWLDRLLASGDVLWVGAGAMGRDGGRVALYLREEAALFGPPPSDASPEGPGHVMLRDALAGGASFWDDLSASVDVPPEEVFAALWQLVWAGEVTNDLWLPLRAPRQAPRLRPTVRPSFGRRGSSTTRIPPAVAGRWSLVAKRFARTPDEAQRRRALAELLLERHGVLTRSATLADGVPGGFSRVYGDLTDLETLGRCRRGYFVEGLGGAQFALPGAVERLRDLRDAPGEPEVLVLGAADPAQPFGATIPWPARDGARRTPARTYGAMVVLVDGLPIVYVERGGRSLLTFGAGPALAVALAALVSWVGAEPRRRLRIERVDGGPAFDSKLVDELRNAGFRLGAKGYEFGR